MNFDWQQLSALGHSILNEVAPPPPDEKLHKRTATANFEDPGLQVDSVDSGHSFSNLALTAGPALISATSNAAQQFASKVASKSVISQNIPSILQKLSQPIADEVKSTPLPLRDHHPVTTEVQSVNNTVLNGIEDGYEQTTLLPLTTKGTSDNLDDFSIANDLDFIDKLAPIGNGTLESKRPVSPQKKPPVVSTSLPVKTLNNQRNHSPTRVTREVRVPSPVRETAKSNNLVQPAVSSKDASTITTDTSSIRIFEDVELIFHTIAQDLKSAASEHNAGSLDLNLSRMSIPASLSKSVNEFAEAIRFLSTTHADQLNELETQLKLRDQSSGTAEDIDQMRRQLDEQTKALIKQQQMQMDLDEKNAGLKKEIARLRQHLAETEEQHTRDVIDIQAQLETEQEKHTSAQSKLETFQAMLQKTNQESAQEIQLLRDQKASLDGEIDRLLERNQALSEQSANLQAVLEGFEASKQAEMDLITGQLRKQVEHLHSALNVATKRAETAEDLWSKVGMSEEQIAEMMTKCADQQRLIESLQKQVSHLSMALSTSTFFTDQPMMEQITSPIGIPDGSMATPRTVTGEQVDSFVIANILTKFFSTEDSKQKTEILILLTKMLKMNDEQRRKMGLLRDEEGKWIRLRRKSIQQTGGVGENDKVQNNLTDQWISFLLNESKSPENDEE